MQKKPRILITNDDGIDAPGIKHLWAALVDHYEVIIVAPSSEKSGTGLSITMRDPLHIQEANWGEKTRAWRISGTPADCVRIGMSLLLDVRPTLIVSGINRGSNSGRNVLYSGTVGGAIEGVLRNVPSIAFSCEEYYKPDFAAAQKYVLPIVRYVLENSLPEGTLLNVNFPTTSDIQGVKLAKQGRGFWIENPEQRFHPEGTLYCWLGGKWHHQEEDEDSDVALLKKGFVAAVPIHVHQLTDHKAFDSHRENFEKTML
ncbi:MAG: 5'/3'-nucleotidase SurE [Chlamydiales bacterium]|nr:5'/3'-nucleotidase SurE [Chlamydiales bacterium]